MIATTFSHYDELINVVSEDIIPMERVILTVSNKTVSNIAKLTKQDKVAVLYRSDNFLELVNDNLKRINNNTNKKEFNVDRDRDELVNEIHNYKVIIVPPEYNRYTDNEFAKLADACKGKTIIVFEYMLDKGSLIHLEEQAQRFWVNKNNRII